MTYIENVFICLAAPLLVAVCCLRGARRRSMLFMLAGMAACLASSYISSFIALALNADVRAAALEITPMIEEIMKLLPILFYLMVFEPRGSAVAGEALMVAVGFATLENACYLTANGAENVLRLLIRGFSTGAMHVACGAITALGMAEVWDRLRLRVASALGALCVAITWHAVFNILVDQTGATAIVGYALPVMTGFGTVLVRRKWFKTE